MNANEKQNCIFQLTVAKIARRIISTALATTIAVSSLTAAATGGADNVGNTDNSEEPILALSESEKSRWSRCSLDYYALVDRAAGCQNDAAVARGCLRAVEYLANLISLKMQLQTQPNKPTSAEQTATAALFRSGPLALVHSSSASGSSFFASKSGTQIIKQVDRFFKSGQLSHIDFPAVFQFFARNDSGSDTCYHAVQAINKVLYEIDPFARIYKMDRKSPRLHDQTKPLSPPVQPEQQTKRVAGIGMIFDDDGIVYGSVFDSPAYHAGVLAGDRIYAVNGVQRRDVASIDVLVRPVAGPRGQTVHLSLQDLRGKVRTLQITRDFVNTASTFTRKLHVAGKNIAYIRVVSFTSDMCSVFRNQVRKLKARFAGENAAIDGWIIDLRQNSGGSVPDSQCVAGTFSGGGVPTGSTRTYESKVNLFLSSVGLIVDSGSDTIPVSITRLIKKKVHVLIDEQTASAAEFVAAHLQEINGAILFGTRTYGKSEMLTIARPVIDELNYFDAVYMQYTDKIALLPSGRSVSGVGLQADVTVANNEAQSLMSLRIKRKIERHPHAHFSSQQTNWQHTAATANIIGAIKEELLTEPDNDKTAGVRAQYLDLAVANNLPVHDKQLLTALQAFSLR